MKIEDGERGWMDDERWIAARDLAASPSFVRSPRLGQLLLFLVSKTLTGRDGAISEPEIARSVFGRNDDFDPSTDTIVRSHLLRLRQRLEQHESETASAPDRFRILIPRGQYLVDFLDRGGRHERSEPDVHRETQPAPSLQPEQPNSVWRKIYLRWALLILVCIGGLGLSPDVRRRFAHPATRSQTLWDGVFQSGQRTAFIAADSSLVILHQFLHHGTGLSDYLSGAYREAARNTLGNQPDVLIVANRRYTSMVDVSIMQHLGEQAAKRHGIVEARFAREFSVEELKRTNAVISGSRGANPWMELFEPQMNFTITNNYEGGGSFVVNRHPLPGEAEKYVEGDGATGHPMFGVLAFLPNLEPSRNVLIMEGTSLAATQAVCDLAFDENSLGPALQKVRRRDGSLPHFELLLSSTVVNGNASNFQILAYRIYE